MCDGARFVSTNPGKYQRRPCCRTTEHPVTQLVEHAMSIITKDATAHPLRG